MEYTCLSGFHLTGYNTIECTENKIWSSRPGLCICKSIQKSDRWNHGQLQPDFDLFSLSISMQTWISCWRRHRPSVTCGLWHRRHCHLVLSRGSAASRRVYDFVWLQSEFFTWSSKHHMQPRSMKLQTHNKNANHDNFEESFRCVLQWKDHRRSLRTNVNQGRSLQKENVCVRSLLSAGIFL